MNDILATIPYVACTLKIGAGFASMQREYLSGNNRRVQRKQDTKIKKSIIVRKTGFIRLNENHVTLGSMSKRGQHCRSVQNGILHRKCRTPLVQIIGDKAIKTKHYPLFTPPRNLVDGHGRRHDRYAQAEIKIP